MRAFLGLESPPLLCHIAPQVDQAPPAAAVHTEDPISQLSFSDGEDNTSSIQVGNTDAGQYDVVAGAAATTSGDSTTSTLGTGRTGMDAADMAVEETEDAVSTAPPSAAARGGGAVHVGGQQQGDDGDKCEGDEDCRLDENGGIGVTGDG